MRAEQDDGDLQQAFARELEAGRPRRAGAGATEARRRATAMTGAPISGTARPHAYARPPSVPAASNPGHSDDARERAAGSRRMVTSSASRLPAVSGTDRSATQP